ncbi:MAG: TetR/AcrR family transcriptional regulator [Verrucomicrobiales bacterium]
MRTMTKTHDHGTKERLIEEAERLFAENGFSAVSLRDITSAAGANVASVKYYFGSKAELVSAVEKRLILPVNAERLSRLDRLEAEGRADDVRELLRAFMEPMLGKVQGNEQSQMLFARFMARFFIERAENLKGEVRQECQKVGRRYIAAFAKIVPWLSPGEILWRLDFSFGAFANSLLHRTYLTEVTAGQVDLEMDDMFATVLDYCECGFLAKKSVVFQGQETISMDSHSGDR